MDNTIWDMPSGHRLEPPDELQIRLLMNVSPAQRIRGLLAFQDVFLAMHRDRLRRAYPGISDLELTLRTYEWLNRNG